MEQILKRRERANINYITTKTIEPIFNQYRQHAFVQSYILPKLPGYEVSFCFKVSKALFSFEVHTYLTFFLVKSCNGPAIKENFSMKRL